MSFKNALISCLMLAVFLAGVFSLIRSATSPSGLQRAGVLSYSVLTFSKTGNGSGTVVNVPLGNSNSCNADKSICTAVYNVGTIVTLTVTPNTGSIFAGWSGACSGTGACIVTMTADKNVTAKFSPASIPPTIFSMDTNTQASFPLQVPYSGWRSWDDPGGHWSEIASTANCPPSNGSDPNDPCYDWSHFDTMMASLAASGVKDILYTMSRTPVWAVDLAKDPDGLNGTDCNYYKTPFTGGRAPGQCLLPTDINADGSGTDKIWRDWVTALATKVNDQNWISSGHAHIKYWEPWNEFFRSTIIANNTGNESFQGTYAEMLRLVEDARCIIKGQGTVHNYPAQGQSRSCANAGFAKTGIDPAALIVAPDGPSSQVPPLNAQDKVLANFLYCDQSPVHNKGTADTCTWSGGLYWGSQAVDIINWHGAAKSVQPEYKYLTSWPNAKAMLHSADLAKPFMCGECSWNDNSTLWDGNTYNQAAYVPRWLAMQISAGFTFNQWYNYDFLANGGLFDPTTGKLQQPVAASWTQTYNWLKGSSPDNIPFCSSSGTVWTCPFTKSNGQKAELVWDAKYGPGGTASPADCANPPSIICGSTAYSVPALYNKDWIDVTGKVHTYQATVTIGAIPVLVEAGTTQL